MENINVFTNLGVSGIALFIVYQMIKYFIAALDSKDEYLKILIIDFKTHIEMCNTNFIKYSEHFSRASDRQAKILEKLVIRVNDMESKQ